MTGVEIAGLIGSAVWVAERILSWFHKTKQSKRTKHIHDAVVKPENPKS